MDFAQLSRGRSMRALALALCVWSLISLSCAARLTDSSRQKLDVQKHLNRLNKPAVKSIKVSFFPFTLHYSFLIQLSCSVFDLKKKKKSFLAFVILSVLDCWESEEKYIFSVVRCIWYKC